MRIQKQKESFSLRIAIRDRFVVPFRAHLPTEVAKHYTTFNPYEPEQDWLKSRAVKPPATPATRDVYTPNPEDWGTDNDAPPW